MPCHLTIPVPRKSIRSPRSTYRHTSFAWHQLLGMFVSLLAVSAAAIFDIDTRPAYGATEEDLQTRLADCLMPWVKQFASPQAGATMTGDLVLRFDDKSHRLSWNVTYIDDESFLLHASHPDYEVLLLRSKSRTAMVLPKHKTIFLSTDDPELSRQVKLDHLQPSSLVQRSLSSGTLLSVAALALETGDAHHMAGLLFLAGGLQLEARDSSPGADALRRSDVAPVEEERKAADVWLVNKDTKLRFLEKTVRIESKAVEGELSLLPPNNSVYLGQKNAMEGMHNNTLHQLWPDYRLEHLPREEFERTLSRGLRRALEVLAPGPSLTRPQQRAKSTENGRLEWVDGQRVVSLWGTPEQIGAAHGQLLKAESMRCLDSVLYAFGTVQTIASGKWFRSELEGAYVRLAPHIPDRHKQETDALADSLGIDRKILQVVNVFPELFHCSGFAVFGDATVGGKLYHGRVLDYMTTIGLQDSATTFIVAPDEHISFANIGYAGFIGSVSGMNSQKISLGEMGGKGEGDWDGVPMATLMRRALEECSTLEQVKTLWTDSPRTCEYYYVFADGKDRTAVGVAATPDSIEFIEPGQGHERLGEGIKDAVVLSAGNRLTELRSRVTKDFGKLDVTSSQNLMCRPVAMKSNLHNVLFVPEDEVFYVANATHSKPAADRPYFQVNLREKLDAIEKLQQSRRADDQAGASPVSPPSNPEPLSLEWTSIDSVNLLSSAAGATSDSDQAERKTLQGLAWEHAEFKVVVQAVDQISYLCFPSPLDTGNEINDQVRLEWFKPTTRRQEGLNGQQAGQQSLPAMLVVHESGRNMTVGKLIARGLASQGVHAFMIHLPHYGQRLSEASKHADPALALKQSIVDVRRGLDAIAHCPGVDAERVSLQGTSLGGFVAATAAGLDDKPHKLFILLAGGDLASVLKNGKKDAQNFRRKLTQGGLSDQDIEVALDAVEPLHLAKRISPSKVWLYSGIYDDIVPLKNATLLAEAIGLDESRHIKLEANHYSGALLLPSILTAIANQASELHRGD